jgi:serine/threonine-protein kinase HipA
MLAPAYDLMNTSLHIHDEDFALEGGLFGKEYYSEIYRQKGHPCFNDFISFGKMIGIPEPQIKKIMSFFLTSQSFVYDLTKRSFLKVHPLIV